MGEKWGKVPLIALMVLFGALNGQNFNQLFSQMGGGMGGIQMQNQQQEFL